MERTPENPTNAGTKTSRDMSPFVLYFLALAQELSIPTEEECQELADNLEKNPPADITPEGLATILKLIRGESLFEGTDASKPIRFI